MSFRDDHDAALARAEALEDELERQRARAEAQANETARLRNERDALKAKVSELQETTRRPEPPAGAPRSEAEPLPPGEREPEGREISGWEWLLIIAVFIAVSVAVGSLAK